MKIILGSERMRALKAAKAERHRIDQKIEAAHSLLRDLRDARSEAQAAVDAAADAIAYATDPEDDL